MMQKLSNKIDVFLHKFLGLSYLLHADFVDRKSDKTVILLHGLGQDSRIWDNVCKQIDTGFNILKIDLLGEGGSPKSVTDQYDLNAQSKSVWKTIKHHKIERTKMLMCGHSLGSLVVANLAFNKSRYDIELLLCSPPIYKTTNKKSFLDTDYRLKFIYSKIIENSDKTGELLKLLASKELFYNFKPNKENISIFMSTLQNAIITQDIFEKLSKINQPVQIIYGAFDLLMNKSNLNELAKLNPNVKVSTVPFMHALISPYADQVAKIINQKNK